MTVQVVLDEELLREADRAARAAQVNLSELVRAALREHLRRLKVLEQEALDRCGYERDPDRAGDVARWERAAAWPDD
ncbi:MAG TPA: ribbon-helix-helix protein, CopG family [Thermoanaerobaculia bacterium]|nr:ribbon-helix-helix protein, CopG family [Thermoanaerobaculia bacterium]